MDKTNRKGIFAWLLFYTVVSSNYVISSLDILRRNFEAPPGNIRGGLKK